MKWIKVLPAEMYPANERGYYLFPEQKVLAKTSKGETLIGYLEWRDEMGDCYTACVSRTWYWQTDRDYTELGSVQIKSEIKGVTHYLPVEDLLNLEKE